MSSPLRSAALKGSWESVLQEASQLDENRNPEAIPLYEKLVTRLQKMPKAKRDDMDGRLQGIFETSCFQAARLCASLDRLDDALNYLTILYDTVEEEYKLGTARMREQVLRMQGRYEEALELLLDLAADDAPPLLSFSLEFNIYREMMDYERGQASLDQARELLESSEFQSTQTEVEMLEHWMYFYRMSHICALGKREWERGIELFDKAMDYDLENDEFGWTLLYRALVDQNQNELAVPIIAREVVPVRRLHWEGINSFRMGQNEEADRLWQAAVDFDEFEEDDEEQALMEWVLSHFYLGDKKRDGLSVLLRALGDEEEEPDWLLFFLAALGWGIQGNEKNTMVNIEHAIDLYRREWHGRTLPWTMWPRVQDLFTPELQAKARPYFNENELSFYFDE